MAYTLYYSPGTASMAVHWALIELAVPFEAVRLDFDAADQRNPTYLRLNPAGRVPTLVIDGAPYSESAALLMLLAERHPQAGLAPAPGDPQRARWLETMVFLANTVSPAMRDWFYADKDGDPAGADAVRDLARSRIEGAWPRLAAALSDGRPFLFGDAPGAADYLAAMLMRWSRNMPHSADEQPELAAYLGRMGSLPSYADLCRREELVPWP
ncbi:glutathione S-transferase family protein [Phenylobacterium sp.]|jgi:glutathione S-transferase|uniref:glutathione S-transferase family protein n=1 Tax=Phenylobacterium sp. TaxID=1871053 RepID=UPI0011F82223|nr:glutathione S-transferase family protein [Phenylobacterium sp.]THD54197.1 MAG: glutathione S-transferase family protein [Phenylobacterium sp.]